MLLEKYRKAKRAHIDATKRREGKAGRGAPTALSLHSAPFKATIANGKAETDVKAGKEADANLISRVLLTQILTKYEKQKSHI